MEPLRIVYFGTPDFAVEGLRRLLDAGYDIAAVVTAPDKPAGRGRKLSASPVKKFALAHNLTVLQPHNLKDNSFLDTLRSFQANLFIVVAFRMLPEAVWNMPRYGTFNLHASLLPQYRGAAPINWAIINGETETGVTTFFINHQIDTGHIILQKKTSISDIDTAGTLHDKLMYLGGDLILETVQRIETTNGQVETIPQPESGPLKPAPKIFKSDCKINWQQPAQAIFNFVRGLSPYPAAWTVFSINGQPVECKIFAVGKEPLPETMANGTIVCDGKTYLKIAVPDGLISILELQPQSKKRMPVKAFLNGLQKNAVIKKDA